MNDSPFSRIPKMDLLIGESGALIAEFGRSAVVAELRDLVAEVRDGLVSNPSLSVPKTSSMISQVETTLRQTRAGSLKPVLNLTGTVLHTNLGRARLPDAAVSAMQTVATQYSNLEYDLERGERGDRDSHIEDLIRTITGAEAATIVNNNAAAVILTLSALAAGKEVPVSRGELVEIGGSFRIPEIMSQSGCRLKEVGATNRTHAHDYENAIGSETALLMKVHTSNYEINGFTHSVSDADVAQIAHRHDLPFVTDLGSGTLIDLRQWQLPYETTVQDSLAAGADIVTFSGDKLLGGPQCGLIVGRADLVAKIKKHPLKRAIRLDKVTIAALAEVLKLYLQPETLQSHLPALRDLTKPASELKLLAKEIQAAVQIQGYVVETCDALSQIGSGALPTHTIDSAGIAIKPNDGKDATLRLLEQACRTLETPIIGRIQDGALIFDLRTLDTTELLIQPLNTLAL